MTALHVERCLPEGYLDRALRSDAKAGLMASPKTLPPKWLYDENGSELFEKITQLDEYYPTRAERSILAAVAGEIAAATGSRGPGAAGPRRRVPARHRPGQGPRGAARRLRRRGRRHRRVQQERAGGAECPAGRELRPGQLRPCRNLGPGPGVDRDATALGRAAD